MLWYVFFILYRVSLCLSVLRATKNVSWRCDIFICVLFSILCRAALGSGLLLAAQVDRLRTPDSTVLHALLY